MRYWGANIKLAIMPRGVYIRTQEARANISAAHKGKSPWNKGIKTNAVPWNKGGRLSEETKNKISESVKSSEKFKLYIESLPKITDDEKKERQKKYKESNKYLVAIWKHRDYERNKESYKMRARKHYIKHREEKLAYAKQYQKDNPDKVRATKYKREKLKGDKYVVTDRDIRRQRDIQKGLCFWCGDRIQKYHIDHVMPLSKGGSHSIGNIVISCPTCNIKKNNRLPIDFIKSKGSAEKNELLKNN